MSQFTDLIERFSRLLRTDEMSELALVDDLRAALSADNLERAQRVLAEHDAAKAKRVAERTAFAAQMRSEPAAAPEPTVRAVQRPCPTIVTIPTKDVDPDKLYARNEQVRVTERVALAALDVKRISVKPTTDGGAAVTLHLTGGGKACYYTGVNGDELLLASGETVLLAREFSMHRYLPLTAAGGCKQAREYVRRILMLLREETGFERYKAAYEACSQLARFPFAERAGELLAKANATKESVLKDYDIDPKDLDAVFAFEQRNGMSALAI